MKISKRVQVIALAFLCHLFASKCFGSSEANIKRNTNASNSATTNTTTTNNNNVNFDPKREPKLPAQFARLKDPSCPCLPGDTGSKEGPEIFANVDCNEDGARWDYNYQVKNNNILVAWIKPFRA